MRRENLVTKELDPNDVLKLIMNPSPFDGQSVYQASFVPEAKRIAARVEPRAMQQPSRAVAAVVTAAAAPVKHMNPITGQYSPERKKADFQPPVNNDNNASPPRQRQQQQKQQQQAMYRSPPQQQQQVVDTAALVFFQDRFEGASLYKSDFQNSPPSKHNSPNSSNPLKGAGRMIATSPPSNANSNTEESSSQKSSWPQRPCTEPYDHNSNNNMMASSSINDKKNKNKMKGQANGIKDDNRGLTFPMANFEMMKWEEDLLAAVEEEEKQIQQQQIQQQQIQQQQIQQQIQIQQQLSPQKRSPQKQQMSQSPKQKLFSSSPPRQRDSPGGLTPPFALFEDSHKVSPQHQQSKVDFNKTAGRFVGARSPHENPITHGNMVLASSIDPHPKKQEQISTIMDRPAGRFLGARAVHENPITHNEEDNVNLEVQRHKLHQRSPEPPSRPAGKFFGALSRNENPINHGNMASEDAEEDLYRFSRHPKGDQTYLNKTAGKFVGARDKHENPITHGVADDDEDNRPDEQQRHKLHQKSPPQPSRPAGKFVGARVQHENPVTHDIIDVDLQRRR